MPKSVISGSAPQVEAARQEGVDRLLRMLHQFHPLDPGLKEFCLEHSRVIHLKRGQLLQRRGETCTAICFILKGAMRGYFENDGTEVTTWVTVEDELVSSIFSLSHNQPAMENIAAVESSELLVLDLDFVESVYERFPAMNIAGRKLLQHYYLHAEIRALLVRIPNADRKYAFFLQHYTHLANRIPVKIIASFLGLRYETVSRIRNRQTARARE